MRRRHRVHVINLAVRSATVVIRSAVPARDPGLFKDRFRAGRDVDLLVFSYICGRRGRERLFLFLWKRRRRRSFRRCMFVSTTAAEHCAEQQQKEQKTWQQRCRYRLQRAPRVHGQVACRAAIQEPFRCVSRKSANWESFPAAVRSAFDECVRTAGTTSSFRYATSSAVSFSRVSAIFATERLKRTEASSTLRSNSVIIIPAGAG